MYLQMRKITIYIVTESLISRAELLEINHLYPLVTIGDHAGCVCVCKRERERERHRVQVCICTWVCVCENI